MDSHTNPYTLAALSRKLDHIADSCVELCEYNMELRERNNASNRPVPNPMYIADITGKLDRMFRLFDRINDRLESIDARLHVLEAVITPPVFRNTRFRSQ